MDNKQKRENKSRSRTTAERKFQQKAEDMTVKLWAVQRRCCMKSNKHHNKISNAVIKEISIGGPGLPFSLCLSLFLTAA